MYPTHIILKIKQNMQFKQYKELIEREGKLQKDMKNFILKALRKAGGRITYISPSADDDETNLDDKYPVISTLYGKHGTCNIAITGVYLKESSNDIQEIYADGIEQEAERKQEGFLIYPEQFSDIIHFITAPIGESIHSYAQRLALKDLVDKYNKLPHDFISEYGGIKQEYHSENRDNIQKYTQELEDIYIRCSEPEQVTGNTNPLEYPLQLLLDIALHEIPCFEQSQTFSVCVNALGDDGLDIADNDTGLYMEKELCVFLYPCERFEQNTTDEEIINDWENDEGADQCVEKYTPDEFAAMMNDEGFHNQIMYIRFIEH
jgi:hypothetical protein